MTDDITAAEHLPRRRRVPWEPTTRLGRFVVWVCAPLLDPHDNYPSGARVMALAIAGGALAGHEISSPLAALLLTTMWGYSAWKAQQEKTTLALSGAGNVAVNYTKTITEARQVIDRRDREQGIEPTS
jgi:hypothetical protein